MALLLQALLRDRGHYWRPELLRAGTRKILVDRPDAGTGVSFVYLTGGIDRDILRLGRRMTAVSALAAAVGTGRSPGLR